MRCGSCGGYNAEYFTWLGVTSVRCPDCGADLMPGAVLPSGELETYRATGLTPNEIAALRDENERTYSALKLAQARAADYEADIEAGRLVRVPCREFFEGAGGTVWLLWGGEAIEMVHCGADIDAEGKPFAALVCEDKIFPYRTPIAEYDLDPTDWCTNVKYVSVDEYERTVFTTAEAARAALEGGQHGSDQT